MMAAEQQQLHLRQECIFSLCVPWDLHLVYLRRKLSMW
jgi:hypothetical protein